MKEYILDSGAYSAYRIGAKIDIDEYCDFIKEHIDIIDHYIVLDVIGSDIKSYENLLYMQSKGLNPLPVFHQGDDFKYLELFVNGDYDFICLSPLDYSAKGSNMVNWLDKCFRDYICDEHGRAKFKVHGLGLTTVNIMIRYPWYSVDSTTWRFASAFGEIFVPYLENNEYNYTKFRRIAVSEKNKKHISNKTTIEYIKKYLSYFKIPYGDEEHEGVSNNNNYRAWANLIFFDNLEKQINQENRVFNVIKKGLFE